MENQNPKYPTTQENGSLETPPSAVKIEDKPKKEFPKILIIGIVFVIIIILGTVLFLVKDNSSKETTLVATPTPILTPITTLNLNPNTGTLYGDIKVRLQEVIK